MARKRVGGIVGVTALLMVMAGPARAAGAQVPAADPVPAPAAAAVEQRPAIAMFEGRAIDLAQDWGEAHACLIWRQGGIVECFRTVGELDARAAVLAPLREAQRQLSRITILSACSSSLRLWDYSYYGGRQLSFWDRGYWQNLWDYGFDNRTSSYAVGGCYAHLAEYAGGGGWWYPGPTYPYAGEPVMSSGWQDVISSIYIE